MKTNCGTCAFLRRFATLGGLLAFSGCDPAVRTELLAGLESASTALIRAFFESLDEEEVRDVNTVRLLEQRAVVCNARVSAARLSVGFSYFLN